MPDQKSMCQHTKMKAQGGGVMGRAFRLHGGLKTGMNARNFGHR